MGSKPAASTPDDADAQTASEAASKPAEAASRPASRKRRAPGNKAETAAELKKELRALETRLDRADTVTRNSVQSLETVVTALQANLKTASASQKGQLTRQVNLLTKKLDDQVAQTRAVIRNELRAALSEGGMDRFGDALDTASAKLDAAEIAQANALARLNKHLADMARAVDARFKTESAQRSAEIGQVRESVETRVARVEKDSADALTKVGETIELVHNKLRDRQQTSTDGIAEKVNELALQTQTEMEAYQAKLEARFDDIEARQLAVGTGAAERVVEKAAADIDHKIGGLQQRLTELEKLERFAARMPGGAPDFAPPPAAVSPSAPPLPPAMPPNPVQVLRDRLSSSTTPPTTPTTGPTARLVADNPYDTGFDGEIPAPTSFASHADFEGQTALARPSHIPVEFNPNDLKFPPTPTAPPLAPPSPVLPFPAPDQTQSDGTPPLPPFQPPSGLVPPPMPSPDAPGNMGDFEPAPLPDAVYANPAYAEDGTDGSPLALRVAEDGPRKPRKTPLTKRLFGSPVLGGKNFKVALMATGAVVAMLLAARMILGGPDASDPTQVQNAPRSAPTVSQTDDIQSGAITITPPAAQTADPIGAYAETEPVVIDSAELDTLEAAVAAGNSIAQFQMGLAQLDAGNVDAGAALIRQSASANQPAALYRLAKLYEAGEGVPQDDAMARQLIERAARGGNRIAMHDLALYYTEGRGGVTVDMQTARSWFEQAARRGVVDSQFNLAVLSESTEVGGTPDQSEALFWYSIAANQGDQFAVTRRDTLRADFNAEQLAAIDTRVAAFAPRQIDEAANGIFNNVPWISATTPSGDPQVRQVQSLLSSLGYSVGPADGLMGDRTRSAIMEFEEANGLRQTGVINGTLIQRLANAAGA